MLKYQDLKGLNEDEGKVAQCVATVHEGYPITYIFIDGLLYSTKYKYELRGVSLFIPLGTTITLYYNAINRYTNEIVVSAITVDGSLIFADSEKNLVQK